MWYRVAAIVLCLAAITVPARADRLVLVDGSERAGIVSRIVLRESIELLQVNPETNEARISSVAISAIDDIVLDHQDSVLYTLIFEAGDVVTGSLIGSPLEELIDFHTVDGDRMRFEAEGIREIRFGMRSGQEAGVQLLPSFGYGLGVVGNGISVTRDAIAWFSEDWMLVASLGIKGWWKTDHLDVGVTNGATYLRRIGKVYWGIGTSVSYDMSSLAWHASLHLRMVFPFRLLTEQSFLSVGIGIERD